MEIPGRLPGLNEYVEAERRNRFKAAKMKRDAQDWVILCIKKYMRGVHITRPVYIRYFYVEPNRRRDMDNIDGYGKKVINDALVEAGVLRDDGWDEIRGIVPYFSVDKDNPRIIVEIEECLDITTNGAGDTMARTVSVSPAPGIITSTKATSGAASGMDDSAAPGRGHARTTSGKAKTSRSKGRKRNR